MLELVSSEDVDEHTDDIVDDVSFLDVCVCCSSLSAGTGSPVGVVCSDLENCVFFSNDEEVPDGVGVGGCVGVGVGIGAVAKLEDEICFVLPLIGCWGWGIRDA